MTMDEAIAARTKAQMAVHWHLTRAANLVAGDCVLGHVFEQEMMLAERARNDWYAAHDAFQAAFNEMLSPKPAPIP